MYLCGMEQVKIYGLVDPIELKIRYIGRTKCSLPMRLSQHVFRAKNNANKSHKNSWIKKLLSMNCKPKIRLLTVVEGWSESHVVERNLINKYRDRLTNHDDRGEGGKNKKLSPGYRKSISETLKKGYSDGSIPHPRNKIVYSYDSNGYYISEHKSIKQCALDLNLPHSSVKKHVRGERNHVKGYFVKFYKVEKLSA